MKIKNIISVLFIALVLASAAYAQPKTDAELTKEEAELKIQEWEAKVARLEAQLQGLESEIPGLREELEKTKQELQDCLDGLYALLEATAEEMEAFRQKIGVLDGKIRAMERMSDDELLDKQDQVWVLWDELNELRSQKMALYPEFYDKLLGMAKRINPGLIREPKTKTYIVKTWAKERDCLWNISGKIDIYGDPFQWPKIWQANTEIIRNPDLIYPGQKLTIPKPGDMTPDEKKAERLYYRNKRAQMEEETGQKGE